MLSDGSTGYGGNFSWSGGSGGDEMASSTRPTGRLPTNAASNAAAAAAWGNPQLEIHK